jgi:sterol desaturase/sphingolipid hydroxylase (fatty acid hydroxylase superfamily)
MEAWQAPVAAGTLIILWSLEAFFPAFTGGKGLAQRARHLVFGLLNAAVSGAVVLLLYAADAWARSSGFGLLRLTEAPWWLEFAVALLLLDLWQYTFHVMAHHAPLLWRFHAVHHNAEHLEATAAMRFHVVEIAVHCLLTIPVILLLGVNILHVAAFNLILLPVSMFHHANLNLPPRIDRALRLLIVTPRMHWLHHSRWQPETNSNYSAVLSIWDRIFGTFRSRKHAETVALGLDGHAREDVDTLKGMLTVPFSPSRSLYGEQPPEEHLEPDEPLFPKRSTRQTRRRDDPSAPGAFQASP